MNTEMYAIIFEKEGKRDYRVGTTYIDLPNSTLENHRKKLEKDGAVIKKILLGSGSWDAAASQI